MIDTVHIVLQAEHAPDIDFMAETPQYLDRYDTGTSKGVEYINSKIANITVSISQYRVLIKGSLCKYWHGNNFKTLTREEVGLAIEKLGQTLHLPLMEANIVRVDVGVNVILSHPVEQYCSVLGGLSRHTRQPTDKGGTVGLRYSSGGRDLKFYNKIKEQKYHKLPIPKEFEDKNILRIELSLSKRLKTYFNQARVTPRDLIDERFYGRLAAELRLYYNDIHKIKIVKEIDIAVIPSLKEQKLAALKMIIDDQGGEKLFCERIKEARQLGYISRKQQYAKTNEIRLACRTNFEGNIDEEAVELVDELSDGFEKAVAENLDSSTLGNDTHRSTQNEGKLTTYYSKDGEYGKYSR